MMENFPNVMREKNHTNPRNTESLNQEEPKEAHFKYIIIKMAKFQDNLQDSKGKTGSNIQGSPDKTNS